MEIGETYISGASWKWPLQLTRNQARQMERITVNNPGELALCYVMQIINIVEDGTSVKNIYTKGWKAPYAKTPCRSRVVKTWLTFLG
jgi:hypothetical protein